MSCSKKIAFSLIIQELIKDLYQNFTRDKYCALVGHVLRNTYMFKSGTSLLQQDMNKLYNEQVIPFFKKHPIVVQRWMLNYIITACGIESNSTIFEILSPPDQWDFQPIQEMKTMYFYEYVHFYSLCCSENRLDIFLKFYGTPIEITKKNFLTFLRMISVYPKNIVSVFFDIENIIFEDDTKLDVIEAILKMRNKWRIFLQTMIKYSKEIDKIAKNSKYCFPDILNLIIDFCHSKKKLAIKTKKLKKLKRKTNKTLAKKAIKASKKKLDKRIDFLSKMFEKL